MAVTPNLNLPLLDSEEKVSEDHLKINQFVEALDTRLGEFATTMAGLATAGHTHGMAKIDGLAEALELLSAKDHSHKLDNLSDVNVKDAPDGKILQKIAGIWGLGDRSYSVPEINTLLSEKVDISGLQSQLDATRDAAVAVIMGGATASQLDTLQELSEALIENDSEIAAIITALVGKAGLDLANTYTKNQTVVREHDSAKPISLKQYNNEWWHGAYWSEAAGGTESQPRYLKDNQCVGGNFYSVWDEQSGKFVRVASHEISSVGNHSDDNLAVRHIFTFWQGLIEGLKVAGEIHANGSLSWNYPIYVNGNEVIHSGNLQAQAAAAGIGSGLGDGQRWYDKLSERSAGVSYQNTHGKPMVVSVSAHKKTSTYLEVKSSGGNWVPVGRFTSGLTSVQTIVPPGSYYRVTSGLSVLIWSELY